MNVKKKVTSIVAPVVTFLLIFAIWGDRLPRQ